MVVAASEGIWQEWVHEELSITVHQEISTWVSSYTYGDEQK